jgi:hypothetical protein
VRDALAARPSLAASGPSLPRADIRERTAENYESNLTNRQAHPRTLGAGRELRFAPTVNVGKLGLAHGHELLVAGDGQVESLLVAREVVVGVFEGLGVCVS